MPYRIIAIDLDDTLLNDAHELTPRTLSALSRASVKGVMIVLSTGRMFRGLKRFYDALNLQTPAITCGGAIVNDSAGNILFECAVPPKEARAVLDFAEKCGVHAQIYIGDDFVFNEHNQYSQIYERFNGFTGLAQPEYLKKDPVVTPKILFISEPERIIELKKEAELLFPSLSINRSKPFYLEFNNPTASKGLALQFIAEQYGIPREEIIAIGDSEIDLSMIKYAGLGVAMANAPESIRQKADFTAPSNNEDGVARIIEKYILEERT